MSFRLRRVHPENEPALARPLSLARKPAFPSRALTRAQSLERTTSYLSWQKLIIEKEEEDPIDFLSRVRD